MPRRRAPSAMVRRAADAAGVLPPKQDRLVKHDDEPLPYVIPSIAALLQDIKIIAGQELSVMRAAKVGSADGQKLRNLAATLATVQETEHRANEEDLSELSPDQMIAAMKAEIARLEGKE